MNENSKNLIMGLDMGTSSIKLLLLNIDNNSIELDMRKMTQKAKIKTENKLFNEQDVDVIVGLLGELISEIPESYFGRIKAIQLCGQMHGVVLWNKETKAHTQLITWQDLRCDKQFLNSLPVKSVSDLSVGFGCGTLFWLKIKGVLNESPHNKMDSAGTIDDFIAFLISGKIIMSIQNALGWGYFDLNTLIWQKELLECSQFPSHLLPQVKEPGFQISENCRLPISNSSEKLIDAKIFTPLGDLQCSVYPCFEKETDCVINMSTSGQVCMPVGISKFNTIKSKLPKSIAVFPYFGQKVLLVSASLNGGNVLENFIDVILDWNRDLGLINESTKIDREAIWRRLIECAIKNPATDLELKSATFYGERHDQETYATLTSIRHNNIKLGQIFDSICAGLITNLSNMFSIDFLANELGCERVVAVGGAFVKNPIFRKHLERVFHRFEIVYKDSSDAALGAAYFLRDHFNKSN